MTRKECDRERSTQRPYKAVKLDDVRIVAVLICAAAVLTAQAGAAPQHAAKTPSGCPKVKASANNTTGDWEVVFGWRRLKPRAVALLNRVHRKGFRCAVIEREQRRYEVAVIGFARYRGVRPIYSRALKKGFKVSIVRS
jgi:hypothetical protein